MIHSIRRHRLVAIIAAASLLALSVAVPAEAGSGGASGTIRWNTHDSWTGGTLSPFGHPYNATFGQWFVAPRGSTRLVSFSYWMRMEPGGVPGNLRLRGELFGWDGSKATNWIWESKRTTVAFTDHDEPVFKKITMTLKKRGKLVAGQQYVMFLTISRDYEATQPGLQTWWEAVDDDLPYGGVAFLDDQGDETDWTTAEWTTHATDLALQATFK